jgi:hypothetical protein
MCKKLLCVSREREKRKNEQKKGKKKAVGGRGQ